MKDIIVQVLVTLVFALALMLLFPIAWPAFHPGFIQCLAIIVVARILLGGER